jgi:hypothetical protein
MIRSSATIAEAAATPSPTFGTFSPKSGGEGLSRVGRRSLVRVSRYTEIESRQADEGGLFGC